MSSSLLWIMVITAMVGCGLSARILLVLPFPSRSHHIFSTAIMRALGERGHQLVEYSPFPPLKPIPNHSHIEIHNRYEQNFNSWDHEDFRHQITDLEKNMIGAKTRRVWEMNYEICEDTLNHHNVQKLLNSKDNFDLIMSESTFGQESLLVLGHKFSAPTVAIESFFPWCVLNRYAGNALSIASVPDLTSIVLGDKLLSFKERAMNFLSVILTFILYHYKHLPLHESIIRNSFNDSTVPPLEDMVANVSLYLTNSHPTAVNYIQPYTPNIVPIGGINIAFGNSSLTEDVQRFMDSAREGVVYFSFGTVVPFHHMPMSVLQTFVNVFERLPQKVLWRVPLDSFPNLPKNVMIQKWVSQQSVLEHPNCKVFITHGGLFSHHETIHAGVPTVGIPFFTDQPYNIQYSVNQGFSVKLNCYTLTEESLYSALTTVLNNPKYRENAQRLSRVYRDRPMSPADSAVFWVEYVLRHRGAGHLRPVSATLSWYQLALLDVLAVILGSFFITLLVVVIITRKTMSFMFGSTHRNQVAKSKKKK